MIRLFVYGTLKNGQCNHDLLAEASFVKHDEARGLLFGGMGAPRVMPPVQGMEGCWVKGEVYDVPDTLLPRIDRLEGHPHGYERTEVRLKSGITASIYYWHHHVRWSEWVTSGEWVGR